MQKQLFLLLLWLLSLAAPVRAEPGDLTSLPLWREGESSDSDPDLERLGNAFTRLAEKIRPAVVQIRSNATASDSDSRPPRNSRGSGFIINPRGYILTAYHVIDGANGVEVRLADRQRFVARVIAVEPDVDLAVLKIEGTDLPALALGESKKTKVGELVASVAYPFGRDSSLSLGVVSRTARSEVILAGLDFIQTDAGASPGSSGGPLVNMRGQVVGMITMASQTGNTGFAIPIDVIKNITPRLVKGEKIVWGWLGVKIAEVTMDQARKLNLSPVRGVLVSSVLPGQPAETGEIAPQDVILAVNGVAIDSPREFTRIIGAAEAGQRVELTIFRKGETFHRSVLLGSKPKSAEGREG